MCCFRIEIDLPFCICLSVSHALCQIVLGFPSPRTCFFTDFKVPVVHASGIHPNPIRRFTSPGDNFGRTPCENSLASPKKLFFPVGFPEFFTGAGASSRGCWWNFRRVYPRTPGIREDRNPKIGDCQSLFQIVDESIKLVDPTVIF
jgi:hypothetical protein